MQPTQTTQKNDTVKMAAVVAVVVGVLAIGVVAYGQMGTTSESAQPSPTATSTTKTTTTQATAKPTTADSAKMAAAFKDGKYEVKGAYRSPAGPEEIDVTVTLKDGMITDAEVVSLATNPGSQKFQGQFISGYKQLVMGKKIDEVKLDVVAGSSLTPKGFNDAVQQIMTQAQAS
jgi:uncharacterized protein with FMN-binding domain